ncbi:hypothetical protein PHYBOEH_011180 [Phytophthora boehmeriae]|uniref:BART domain-containing protein n=1 Tax=Phytophthora boehmeriae TaxID=109152 RepID=A0A8T1X385_9STRA|nr:hypothetical protein PHYBOEH_011180 [Phytophthora boehmeriae]
MPSESKTDVDFDDAKADEKNLGDGEREAKAHGGDEKASAKDGDDKDLVNKVITYFFDNDEFARTFETFAEENCHAFDLDSEEMKLEYTDIYNEFLALFEKKLEGYIKSQGATVHEFYDLVRQAYQTDRESGTVLCSEILVATADFDVFVLMMRQTKEAAMLAKR